MSKLKTLFVAAALSSLATAAFAECHEQRTDCFPDQNDRVTFTALLSGKGSCMHEFRSPSGLEFTGASIAERPANGTLSKIGPTSFMYKPKPGVSGRDQYAIKICGVMRSHSGCSMISFDTTVN